jgi:hypothetical protein
VTPGEGLRRSIQPMPNVRLRGGLRRARMSRPGRVRQIECTADRDALRPLASDGFVAKCLTQRTPQSSQPAHCSAGQWMDGLDEGTS